MAAKHGHPTPTIKDQGKIQVTEMGFLQSVRGYTRTDRMRNDPIQQELNIFPHNDRIAEFCRDWLPKMLHQYKPKGIQDVGRARKCGNGTGQGPNPWLMMMIANCVQHF